MKSAQLLRRNVSLVFVGLYLVFIARKNLQKTSQFYKIRL